MNPQAPSFIPKKPLTGSGVYTSSLAFGSVFFLLALLIFMISLVSAGAVFVYQGYLTSSIASKKDSLNKAQAAFDPDTIRQLVRMDARLINAQLLLQKHVAPSALFAFIGSQTLPRVDFSSFSYGLGEDGSVSVSLSGEADGFATLALQSDQLNNNKALKDVIFSGIAVGSSGKVTFSVHANVDPALINYSNVIASGDMSAAQPASSAATNTQNISADQTTPQP